MSEAQSVAPAEAEPVAHTDRAPYVGARPFTSSKDDIARFAGREAARDRLVSVLVSQRVVLVHADSGAGKTSLINAGVIPMLESPDYGWSVLPVTRVGGALEARTGTASDGDTTDNPYLGNVRDCLAAIHKADPGASSSGLIEMLADHRSSLVVPTADEADTDAGSRQIPRLLVIDQAEELLTWIVPDQEKHIQNFFKALSSALEADRELRLLFVVRNDQLAGLLRYAPLILQEFRVRFELERLTQEDASEAIERPIGMTSRKYAAGVVQAIVSELSKVKTVSGSVEDGKYVEPVQLQVVCTEIWRSLPPDAKEVTLEHVRKAGDVTKILARFYADVVTTCSKATHVGEHRLRTWIESNLITELNTRGPVALAPKQTKGLANECLRFLADHHLIRGETRAGAYWYELAHDRLIEPIREENSDWLRRHFWYRIPWRFVLPALTMLAALGGFVYYQNAQKLARLRASIDAQEEAWTRRLKECGATVQGCAATFDELGLQVVRFKPGSEPESNLLLHVLKAMLVEHQRKIPRDYAVTDDAPAPPELRDLEEAPEFRIEYNTLSHFRPERFAKRWTPLAKTLRADERLDVPLRPKVVANANVDKKNIRLVIDVGSCFGKGESISKEFSLPDISSKIPFDPDASSEASGSSTSKPQADWFEKDVPGLPLRFAKRWALPLFKAQGLSVEPVEALLVSEVARHARDNPSALLTCRGLARTLGAELFRRPATVLEAMTRYDHVADFLTAIRDVTRESHGFVDRYTLEALADARGNAAHAGKLVELLREDHTAALAKENLLLSSRPPSPSRPSARSTAFTELWAKLSPFLDRELTYSATYVELVRTSIASNPGDATRWRSFGRLLMSSDGYRRNESSILRVRLSPEVYRVNFSVDEFALPEFLARFNQFSRASYERSGLPAEYPFITLDRSIRGNQVIVDVLNRRSSEERKSVVWEGDKLFDKLEKESSKLDVWNVTEDTVEELLRKEPEAFRSWLTERHSITDLKLILRSALDRASTRLHNDAWLLRSLVYWHGILKQPTLADLGSHLADTAYALDRKREGAGPPANTKELIKRLTTAPAQAEQMFRAKASATQREEFLAALALAQSEQRANEIGRDDCPHQRGEQFKLEEFFASTDQNWARRCLLRAYAAQKRTRELDKTLIELMNSRKVEEMTSDEAHWIAREVVRGYEGHYLDPPVETRESLAKLLKSSFSQPAKATEDHVRDALGDWNLQPRWLREAVRSAGEGANDAKKQARVALKLLSYDENVDTLLARARDRAGGNTETLTLLKLVEARAKLVRAERASRETRNELSIEARRAVLGEFAEAQAKVQLEHLGTTDEARSDMAALVADSYAMEGSYERGLELIELMLGIDDKAGAEATRERRLECRPASGSLYARLFSLNLALGRLEDGQKAISCMGVEGAYYEAIRALLGGSDEFEDSVAMFVGGPYQSNEDNVRVLAWWRMRRAGRAVAADATLRRRYELIDQKSWPKRLKVGDPYVWGEKLVVHAAIAAKIAPPGPSPLEGLHDAPQELLDALSYSKAELRCDAHFYDAIVQSVTGSSDAEDRYRVALKEAIATEVSHHFEYAMARYLDEWRAPAPQAKPQTPPRTRSETRDGDLTPDSPSRATPTPLAAPKPPAPARVTAPPPPQRTLHTRF